LVPCVLRQITGVHYTFANRTTPCPDRPTRSTMTLLKSGITHEETSILRNHQVMRVVIAHSVEVKPSQIRLVHGACRFHLVETRFSDGVPQAS
ncbi:hypothetical protein PMAYCL1PPCAC_21625, partial [Pristionchus mayeri]